MAEIIGLDAGRCAVEERKAARARKAEEEARAMEDLVAETERILKGPPDPSDFGTTVAMRMARIEWLETGMLVAIGCDLHTGQRYVLSARYAEYRPVSDDDLEWCSMQELPVMFLEDLKKVDPDYVCKLIGWGRSLEEVRRGVKNGSITNEADAHAREAAEREELERENLQGPEDEGA